VAELAQAWARSLADFGMATKFRPQDIGYAVDYDNAQARWLEIVRSSIDGLEPEQAYDYLMGEPAKVSRLLIGPNSADFRNLLAVVTKKVAANSIQRMSRAVSLADDAEFGNAYKDVNLARPYAGLVPNFQALVNRIQLSEVDHGIKTASALARQGDFKGAYSALDAVREHSNLEPGYGAAVLEVRDSEVRWKIADALVSSRNGDYEGALAQLSALEEKGLLSPEIAAARSRVRKDAQFSSIKRLAEAVLKEDVGRTRKEMDRYSRLTGYHFSCQPETLINERDLGRFLAALEDLHIRPKANEVRTGCFDLDLVESLRGRFTDQAQVSSFLGEGYKSYAYLLADKSRPGFALYLMERAKIEGVGSDPEVSRRLLAALANAFSFTIYMPSTRTTASHPGPLVSAPRVAVKAVLQRTVGSWMKLSDVPLQRSLSGLIVGTSLANIKVADNPQSETRTVRYQSGWDQVPNPEYASIAERLRQAQQNERQAADQNATNQQLAQSAVNSGGLSLFGAALVGAGAGLSKAALEQAQQNVSAWSARLQGTPPTLQNAVYADEPYEATTHSVSYDASFSADVEVGGSPYSGPVTWSSNYSYNTVEIVGNAAHNVPVQSATYVPMDGVVQALSDSISKKLSDQSDQMLAQLVGATQDVLDKELKVGKVSDEISADARWGLIALWKSCGVPVGEGRTRAVEVAIRRSLGLNPNPASASSNPGPVTGSPTHDQSRAQGPAPVGTPIGQVSSPVDQSVAVQPVAAVSVRRGVFGVQLEKLTPELVAKYGLNSGILVKDVLAGGPADKGGLASGDVITKLDGETIDSINRFRLAAKDLPPGRMVTVEYVRNGQTATATVELGIPPPSPVQHGFFGVQLGELSPELAAKYGLSLGTLVTGVLAGGPAEKAGLAGGDIITKLDGEAMDSSNKFGAAVRVLAPGRMVTVEYVRNGQTATATVELGIPPPPPVQHGFFGVQLGVLSPELAAKYGLGSGTLVTGVQAGGPADKAGLASGDVITKLDGQAVDNLNQFRLAAKDLPAGRMVTLEYIRNGQTATATVELGAHP
jgi:S1-C subfamily serine protease